jgi:O-antigen/teichoic acid export membrane protein
VYSKRYQGSELASYAGSVWFHHFAVTALGIVMLLAAIAGLSLAGAVRMAPGLWALLAAGPFILLREWIRRFAYANLQIVPAVMLDAVVAVAQLGGLLLLWRLQLLSIFSIFAVMGAACAIACVGWFVLDRPAARFDPSRYRPDWTKNWSFGRWALRSYVVGSTIPFVMPWILGLTVGMAAAGVLAACNTLINISNLFLVSMDRVLIPRAAQAFARGHAGDLRRVLTWAALVILPALGAFCLVVFLFGSRLAVFVFGDQYRGHGDILTALALVMFANGVGTIAGTGLWAIDKPRINFTADVVTLLVTIAAGFALVVPLGAFGAALAILAGTSTGCVVRTLRLQRALALCEVPTEVNDQQPLDHDKLIERSDYCVSSEAGDWLAAQRESGCEIPNHGRCV